MTSDTRTATTKANADADEGVRAPNGDDGSLVLGIETSCDETAASVIRGGEIIESSVVASQEELHARFGGIVPEVASRKHVELLPSVVEQALRQAEATWDDLSAIAVTHGPGLVGSLIVGVAAAKAYAMASDLPLIGVNHLEAHVHAALLRERGGVSPFAESGADFPLICLVASGGHCDLLRVPCLGQYELLGCARDDAPGEAFDKAARLLGLGYPGGPAIERAAAEGDPNRVELPRPLVRGALDFSFSGLKTALVRLLEGTGQASQPEEATTNKGHCFPLCGTNGNFGDRQSFPRCGTNGNFGDRQRNSERPEFRRQSPGQGMGQSRTARAFPTASVADLAASFQAAVVDTLVRNTMEAIEQAPARGLVLSGGVAANTRLRESMAAAARQRGVPFAVAPRRLCTDNAAMVAAAGHHLLRRRGPDDLTLDVFSTLPLGQSTAAEG